MFVMITEISSNGQNIIYQGPATNDEINKIRLALSRISDTNPYISFLIGNEFFTFNMKKVKGFNVKSDED